MRTGSRETNNSPPVGSPMNMLHLVCLIYTKIPSILLQSIPSSGCHNFDRNKLLILIIRIKSRRTTDWFFFFPLTWPSCVDLKKEHQYFKNDTASLLVAYNHISRHVSCVHNQLIPEATPTAFEILDLFSFTEILNCFGRGFTLSKV